MLLGVTWIFGTTNATSKVDVLRHDGDSLGVDGKQIGVLEESNEVILGSLMKCGNSSGSAVEICPHLSEYLTHETGKRSFADEELRGLLVSSDLAEGDRAGAKAMSSFRLNLASARG